jgi:Ca2+/Na+ antiporter
MNSKLFGCFLTVVVGIVVFVYLDAKEHPGLMVWAFAALILFLLLVMLYIVVTICTRQRIQKLEEDNKVLMDKNLCLEEICKESSRTKRCFDNFKAEVELFDKVWKGSNEKQEDMDPSKLSEYFAHWVKDFKTFNELYKANCGGQVKIQASKDNHSEQ